MNRILIWKQKKEKILHAHFYIFKTALKSTDNNMKLSLTNLMNIFTEAIIELFNFRFRSLRINFYHSNQNNLNVLVWPEQRYWC